MEGLDKVLSELKAQGRNLNQLTTLANMGKVTVVYGDKLAESYLQSVDALRKAGITATIRRSNGKRIIQLSSADSDDNEAPREIGTIDPVDQLAEGNAEGSDNGDSSL